jgi:hypothetical protein
MSAIAKKLQTNYYQSYLNMIKKRSNFSSISEHSVNVKEANNIIIRIQFILSHNFHSYLSTSLLYASKAKLMKWGMLAFIQFCFVTQYASLVISGHRIDARPLKPLRSQTTINTQALPRHIRRTRHHQKYNRIHNLFNIRNPPHRRPIIHLIQMSYISLNGFH